MTITVRLKEEGDEEYEEAISSVEVDYVLCCRVYNCLPPATD